MGSIEIDCVINCCLNRPLGTLAFGGQDSVMLFRKMHYSEACYNEVELYVINFAGIRQFLGF